ncbi:ADP,ATP carrier protein ER-ANT1 isoform X4 [Euphorbia lathyris]|uniref:ADP,ATP carrier protein ER-ANT1 isoform X4 n=1 Tax=Euphorbia lathyris TaxID=212925 RepID=UPI003313F91C
MARKSENFSTDFLMGGAAAVVSKSAAAPIERVKLLLQNQGEMVKRGHLKKPYMGVRDCFGRILREEGLFSFWRGFQLCIQRVLQMPFWTVKRERWLHQVVCWECGFRKTCASDGIAGLYRGFGVSIVGITLYRGMYFGIYDTMKPLILVGPFEANFFASFLLGWSITTVSGVCAYPFDTVRRRMMLTSGQPFKYRNAMHACQEIIRHEGFRALYRGVTANMLVGIAGAGVLAGYDKLQRIALVRGYVIETQKNVLK